MYYYVNLCRLFTRKITNEIHRQNWRNWSEMGLCINVEGEEEEVAFQDQGLFIKSQVEKIIYMILFNDTILSYVSLNSMAEHLC